MGQMAKRYAKALFEAAGSDISKVQSDLENLLQLENSSPEWSGFIHNPLLRAEQIQGVFEKVFQILKVQKITQNFLQVIVHHRRFTHLSLILHATLAYFDKKQGRKFAIVKSPRPLEISVQGKISTILSKQFHGDVQVRNITDPKVLGGVSILIESQLFDGTIHTQLQTIQRQLREA